MNIIKDSTNNRSIGRAGVTIDTIVLHSTYGSYEGSVAWLKNPQAQASAHYIISTTGEIRQLVEEKDTAWANGNLASNRRSVTIETTDDKKKDITPQAKEALIWLVNDIKKRYSITDIKFHREIINTACPYLNIDKAWFTNSNPPMDELQACLTAHREAVEAANRKDEEIKKLKQESKVTEDKLKKEKEDVTREKDTLLVEVSRLDSELTKTEGLLKACKEQPKQDGYKEKYETLQKELTEVQNRIEKEYVKKANNSLMKAIQLAALDFDKKYLQEKE